MSYIDVFDDNHINLLKIIIKKINKIFDEDTFESKSNLEKIVYLNSLITNKELKVDNGDGNGDGNGNGNGNVDEKKIEEIEEVEDDGEEEDDEEEDKKEEIFKKKDGDDEEIKDRNIKNQS